MTAKTAALLLTALVLAAACGGGKFSTPESTVETFLTAMRNKDVEGMRACMVKAERGDARTDENDARMAGESGARIGKAIIDGDSAKVPVTSKDDDGKDFTWHVVCRKEDGEWRVSRRDSLKNFLADMLRKAADKISD